MKKYLILLLIAVLLVSCSSNSDDSYNSNKNQLNPPSWIQGRWLSDVFKTSGYKFTNNNFCMIASSNQEICYKEIFENYSKAGVTVLINEDIISNTEYKFSFSVQGSTQYFHFVKVSNTKIKDNLNDPDGFNPFIKE